MIRLLARNYMNSYDSILNDIPVKEFENDEEFYWDVISSSRKNVPLIEARAADNTTVVTSASANVGVGGDIFYLVFPEDWFSKGEVIVGNLNQVYPIRVRKDAVLEGTNAVYECETYGGLTQGIPAERLLQGERFSIEYAPVEREGSRKVSDIHFASPVAMRNEWSTIRIHHKVWGNKLGKKVAFGIPLTKNVNGKEVKSTEDMWMHNVDWQLEQEFAEHKNNVLLFGTSNRNKNGEYLNYGDSGNVIRSGSGIFEQTEVANIRYYNKFSLKLLEDALLEISTSKLGMKDRVFTLNTGQRGAVQFHKAVLDEVSGWTVFTLDNSSVGAVQKTTSPLHTNALSAGFQFTEYKAPNGIVVKLNVDDFYDDPVRNKVLHKDGGVAMSYRYDIWSLGTPEQPNIQKCKIKGDNEVRSYQYNHAA